MIAGRLWSAFWTAIEAPSKEQTFTVVGLFCVLVLIADVLLRRRWRTS